MARRLVLGKVAAAFEGREHRAHAIDLPGHDVDPTPAATVTLEDYVCAIGAALRARGGRSVPVGHFDRRHFETRAVGTTAPLKSCEFIVNT